MLYCLPVKVKKVIIEYLSEKRGGNGSDTGPSVGLVSINMIWACLQAKGIKKSRK